MNPHNDFDALFEALTGNPPFPWQQALYERFIAGDIPESCNLPTGLGKTSVIAVWLIALAQDATKMPRRLVYVVNRRTVVDQTTFEVEEYRRQMKAAAAGSELHKLRERLADLCALKLDDGEPPLALSTLRGQFADNREWSADPARPAVICGTVDMIGSRLLFSGYGLGFKTRPLHAGFLGQDALLVHDEAHLEPAFQELLVAIEQEQQTERERFHCPQLKPFRVMELSATTRTSDHGESIEPFVLTSEDQQNEIVKERILARKNIDLHVNADEKKLADEITEQALKFEGTGRAILVFVQKVEDVDKVLKKLPGGRKQQLTGTMRGLEREWLIETPVFKRFLPSADVGTTDAKETVYLVCTSAGEVGVNISADHLVCDLTTFDSMTQRFGRVNRFGKCADSQIHIFFPQKFDEADEYQIRRRRTLDLLERLKGNGSPQALTDLPAEARSDAFAPQPVIPPTSDILFDSWALTTIYNKLPGRPPVEAYLHGIRGWEPPETHVAWREEVGLITGELLKSCKPVELLDDYPLKPHELLRDNSGRVFDRLKKLRCDPLTPVWLIAADQSVKPTTLDQIIESGKEELFSKIILLPPAAGGLSDGMLISDSEVANDVADEWYTDKEHQHRRRVRLWDEDLRPKDMRLIRTIDLDPDNDEQYEPPARRFWNWYELRRGGDTDGSRSSNQEITWPSHVGDVSRNTFEIVRKLSLDDDLKAAIRLAAAFHDHGKRRKGFQAVLGNFNFPDPAKMLAKSGKRINRLAEKYRHEFGSLFDLVEENSAEYQHLGDDLRDLVLHLIAAHHGRARPHFPADEAYDPDARDVDARQLAAEVPRRFAKLQRKYGRWGLAYLESLLRAADYAASANPTVEVESQEMQS